MNTTDIKKDLYKSKELAKISKYCNGNLYYVVKLSDGLYEFPISVIETTDGVISLSSDLGTTDFYSEIKGSDLNRWIQKAFEKDEFIKVG